MDGVFIDNAVVFFGVVYYAFLVAVYIVSAYDLSDLELKMASIFSVQLIPFGLLWVLNIMNGDRGRIFTLTPIVAFLLYDLWYRLLSRKKPQHHPDRWPKGLVVYLILLFLGSIGLNWYGFLVSDFYGNVLVIAFFVMMSSFGFYQYRYRKK